MVSARISLIFSKNPNFICGPMLINLAELSLREILICCKEEGIRTHMFGLEIRPMLQSLLIGSAIGTALACSSNFVRTSSLRMVILCINIVPTLHLEALGMDGSSQVIPSCLSKKMKPHSYFGRSGNIG